MQIKDGLIQKGNKIGVAVSGGRDSMCLLHYLLSIRESVGFELAALSVEHGIRGEESLKEQSFVAEFCRVNAVPLYACRVDAPLFAVERRISIEQSARELRYGYFERLLSEGVVDKIATAHHLDDQCETVLMRIFRGTGIKGLAGIPQERDGKYIRPFIGVTRQEINDYQKVNSVPFMEDSSNLDTSYSRNYIRQELLPPVEARFPAYRTGIARLSASALEMTEYMDTLAVAYDVDSDGAVIFDVRALSAAALPLRKHSIRKAMSENGWAVDFEECNLADALSLLDKQTGKEVCLAGGVTAVRESERLTIYCKLSNAPYEVPFRTGDIRLPQGNVSVREYKDGDKLKFDIAKVPQDAVLRGRRSGDRFTSFGGHSKSLGDYFTDIKLPRRKRDALTLVACGNEILIIKGIEISSSVKVDEDTKDIYTIQ